MVPQNEGSPNPKQQGSPGFAPPDFSDPILKEMWVKLTNEEQNQILALPEDQQEEATNNIIINRPQPPFAIPNYGSDGELNHYFAALPRSEQIELLKLSHQMQIKKLIELGKSESSETNDFSKLRITIPQNKTSSEELYSSPELKLLAPEPTPVAEEDKKDINNGSNDSSNSNSSASNIKKIIF